MESLFKTSETIIEETAKDVVESVVAPLAAMTNVGGSASGGLETTTSDLIPSAGVEPDLFLRSLSKTIYLDSFEITTTKNAGEYLNRIPIIKRLMAIRSQLREVIKMWRFFRSDIEFTIQVNAPIGSTGAFYAFFIPPNFSMNVNKWSKATIFNWPGVEVNYGTMTTATLKVPFIHERTYWTHVEVDDDHQPNLGFYVMAPYKKKNDMSNVVDVTVMATFVNLTMTCPILDFQAPQEPPPNVNEKSRYTKFKYTEPKRLIMESDGSANLSNSISTGLNISSALMGERIYYSRNTVGDSKPIQDLLEVAKIPSMPCDSSFNNPAGHDFVWTTAKNKAESLFKYSYRMQHLGNLGYMAEGFQGFSGTINVHLTAFASKLHRGRLIITVACFVPSNPNNESMDYYPRIQYAVLDLAASTDLIIPVPFMFDSWMYPLNDNAPGNLFRINVSVMNRLGSSAAAASDVTCMIRFSAGKDFRWYFLDEPDITVQGMTSWGSEMDLADPLVDEADHQLNNCHITSEDVDTMLEDKLKGHNPTTLGAAVKQYKISPISYSNVRAVFGRAWLHGDHTYEADTDQVHVPLHIPKTTHGYLMHFFSYFAGELNLTICNDSDNTLVVCHSYSALTGKLESAGSLAVPARRIITFTAPFYSLTPVKSMHDENSPVFGHLYVNCGYLAGSFKLFLSIKNPNFFIPHPCHRRATARDVVQKAEYYQPTPLDAALAVETAEDPNAPFVHHKSMLSSTIRKLVMHAERKGWRGECLNQCGDVEENPGPDFRACYIQRGLYKHYGMTDGKQVVHLNTEDILWSAVTGKAKVMITPLTGQWIMTDDWTTMHDMPPIEEMEFSIDSNCETYIRKFMHINGLDQGLFLKHLAFIFVMSLSTALYDQDVTSTFSTLVSNIMGYTTSKIVKRVLKFILRMVLYAVLFAHAPCIATGGSVAALLIMDIMAAREGIQEPWVDGFVKAAIEGDVGALLESVAEGLEDDENKKESFCETVKYAKVVNQNPFDDFNKATLSFKNVEWWLDLIKKFIDMIKERFSPGPKTKFLKEVKNHGDHLAALFTTATALKEMSRRPLFRPDQDYIGKVEYARNLATHWMLGFQQFAPHAPLAGMVASAHKALQSIDLSPSKPSGMTRAEPLGVYICGEAGQGKSFLTTRVCVEVARKMGWDVDDVYFHPTGSKYLDGYRGQNIHIIDDFGQNVAEEEYSMICQMISTTHFTVPMARLEDKGAWYDSKLVIATSNRQDFSSTTLFSKEALQRRFPIFVKIRANPVFCYNGILQVSAHMDRVKNSTVWLDENGHELDVSRLVDQIVSELQLREDTSLVWSSFINQSPVKEQFKEWAGKLVLLTAEAEESIFGQQFMLSPTDVFLLKVKQAFGKIDNALRKYGHWMVLITTLGTIAGALGWWAITNKRKKQEANPETSEASEEQVYNGQPTLKPKKTLFTVNTGETQVVDQSPMDEFKHLDKSLVRLVADRVQVFGLAIGGDKILTYAHSRDILFKASEVYVVYGEHKLLLEKPTFKPIMVNDKQTDLAIVKTNCGMTFVNGLKQYSEEFTSQGAIVWNTKNGFHIQYVDELTPLGATYTLNGTWTHDTIQYRAHTSYGTCGGMLICKMNGMWKFVGMHMAGNGFVGRAVRLPPFNQGNFHELEPLDLPPAHLNRKTKLQPSPLHEVWEVKKGPATLSKFDKRTEGDPMEQIVAKNVGNVFNPNVEKFTRAVLEVKDRIKRVVGVKNPLTMDQAVFLMDRPIDTTTSPGFKYTSQGFTKKKLIDYDKKEIHPILRADVQKMMDQLQRGECDTYFTTAFKDELRTLEKIKTAKTRVIEASNLDYTVCFRMLFGSQFDILCREPKWKTGICLGICPYTDWTYLIKSLYANNYDFDYKAFDGSLSVGLMEAALDVMCATSTKPEMLRALGMATIHSVHHGPGFDYYLEGSNPSGTPFTTVLNCLANLIVVEYFMQDLNIPYLAYTYGDDLILSAGEDLPIEQFATMLKTQFGMTITPSDKGETFRKCTPVEVSFLKRKPVFLTPTTVVGALDLDEMKQNVMWCRGPGAFEQQILSFTLELSLHGKKKFDQVKQECATRGVHLMDFELALIKMKEVIFD